MNFKKIWKFSLKKNKPFFCLCYNIWYSRGCNRGEQSFKAFKRRGCRRATWCFSIGGFLLQGASEYSPIKCSYSPLPPPNSWGCTSVFPLCIKVEIWAQEWLHSGWQWWPGTTQENQPEWANLKTCSFLPGLWNPPESNPEEEQKMLQAVLPPCQCSNRSILQWSILFYRLYNQPASL